MHTEDENFGENTICQVFQKGFKLGEKIIRFAMVQVANKKIPRHCEEQSDVAIRFLRCRASRGSVSHKENGFPHQCALLRRNDSIKL